MSKTQLKPGFLKRQPVILQVLPEMRSGGVERGTVEIARAIKQAGWTSLVASEPGGTMLTPLARAGAMHIPMRLSSKNPFVMWINALRLAAVIRRHKVTIIHARSRAPAWSAWLAAQRTGCRFVTTFHGTYRLQNKWKQRYNNIMTRGDRVIAVSHFIADHILKNYAMQTDRLRIIHRGVDLKLFNPANHSPSRLIELTREWNLPETLPLILFPGRISRWKGQDVFLQALASLPHRNFFAVILGDDKGHETYREELEKLITESDLEGHVRIAPHTHHITEAYMLAKVVVATSLEPEAFGRVVLEAQAMGKPVIATSHGGPQETVLPNITGWLVTPGDARQLAERIEQALGLSEEDTARMAVHSMHNAQKFSLGAMCEKTLAVYEELAS
ncbi:MAG: glycosyltransferase [Alphaproteobacteria bacterium]|nr:glycosyltransferase [Alphaproteobacteria bacterium]